MGELDHDCRLLVVDDDPVIRTLVRMVCEDDGAVVREASHGLDALALLAEAPASVIVLDLNMPVMDGPAFARELRARGDRTPIIVLSAHDAHAGGQAIGAARSVDKPFDIDELLGVIRDLCHGSRQEHAPAQNGVGTEAAGGYQRHEALGR